MTKTTCRACRQLVDLSTTQRLDGKYNYCYPICESKLHASRIDSTAAKIENYSVIAKDVSEALLESAMTIPQLASLFDLDELEITRSDLLTIVVRIGAEWDTVNQNWKLNTVTEKLEADKKTRKLQQENRDLRKQYRAALDEIESLEAKVEQTVAFVDVPVDDQRFAIAEKEYSDDDEGTMIVLASDWHVEETIHLHETDGLNEYNPTIAELRSEKFFVNTRKMLDINRAGVDIPNLVLWIGGDIINNVLRDEDLITNAMSPTEAVMFAQDLFISGINYLLEDTGIENLTVVTSTGNHGRLPRQKKTYSAVRDEYSLEGMLYSSLAKYYQRKADKGAIDGDRIKFKISNSYHNYLDVYGRTVRFSHGDKINYNGGVMGIAAPVTRYFLKQNAVKRSYIDCIGHFHSLNYLPGAVVNGSLVGYNAYAMEKGFGYEDPQQAYFIISQERGLGQRGAIFVK